MDRAVTSYANPTYQTPTRLNQLPAAASVNAGDLLLISQNGVSKQATASQVADGGLSPTGVTAGTYGTASQVGQFTVNAQGLLTSASDIAIAIAASQVTSGQLALARGGTGADLSATGGANQFVRQSSAGAAFTVSALANADIPATLTGKAFNGTLGATTPDTAAVTTLTTTGNITMNRGAAGATIFMNANAGQNRFIEAQSGGVARWRFFLANSTAETGADAGSNVQVNSLTDAGGALRTALFMRRSDGVIALGGGISAECLRITPTASQDRAVTITGGNGTPPIIGASIGGIINVSAATLTIASATAIPAGGTAGTGIQFGSASTNPGVFFGSGAPTLSAGKGSLYLRSDGTGINDRMYVNTNGSTTWTAVVTVA